MIFHKDMGVVFKIEKKEVTLLLSHPYTLSLIKNIEVTWEFFGKSKRKFVFTVH